MFGNGTQERAIAALFHILDINEDGFIDFEEWAAHHQIMGIDTLKRMH